MDTAISTSGLYPSPLGHKIPLYTRPPAEARLSTSLDRVSLHIHTTTPTPGGSGGQDTLETGPVATTNAKKPAAAPIPPPAMTVTRASTRDHFNTHGIDYAIAPSRLVDLNARLDAMLRVTERATKKTESMNLTN